jgi:hypothetical protein
LNKKKYPDVKDAENAGDEQVAVADDFGGSTSEASTTATEATAPPRLCQPLQYELMKDNLMLYHHEKVSTLMNGRAFVHWSVACCAKAESIISHFVFGV